MINFQTTCPIPLEQYPQVLLAHGGGGKLMQQLLEKMIFSVFQMNKDLSPHDSSVVNIPNNKIAFTTDSYVVNPLFFPGGDIGSLAINGTVNDLAMSGARPLYISLGFIIEEGFEMKALWDIIQSLQKAAKTADIQVITGDTKVVDKGKGDGIFINSSGIGVVEHDQFIAPESVQVGDKILINGDIGRHGISVMATREGLKLETTIKSDCQPLHQVVLEMIKQGVKIHCLRDLTRGGLASSLNEIASSAKMRINIIEKAIPIMEDVKGACEILGFDPLYIANEGKFIAFIPKNHVDKALEIMTSFSNNSCIIGEVTEQNIGLVTLNNEIGTTRIVDMLSGEQLPRIC